MIGLKIYSRLKQKLLAQTYRILTRATSSPIAYRPGRILFHQPSIVDSMIYKDETWNYVKELRTILLNRSFYRTAKVVDNHCNNNKIEIDNEEIHIKSYDIHTDWVYWYFDEILPDAYILKLNATILNTFTEFQIAFKHKSIVERCRFRVVDNSLLSFEVVNHGYFFDKLITTPFQFEIGRNYEIQVLVKNNQYAFIVDSVTILSVTDNINMCHGKGIALIFWDEINNSKIDLSISNLNLIEVL
jgi:hypothetical protein